jgi:hypothetical protein
MLCRSDDSDALSTLAALCAFEASGSSDAFCRDAFLHTRHLREMADLRKQLARTLVQVQQGKALGGAGLGIAAAGPDAQAGSVLAAVSAVVEAAGELLSTQLPPPSRAVQDLLRRATAAGWADQVTSACCVLCAVCCVLCAVCCLLSAVCCLLCLLLLACQALG